MKTLLLLLLTASFMAPPALAVQDSKEVAKLLRGARKGSKVSRVGAIKELAKHGRAGGDALGQIVLDFDDDTFAAALERLRKMGPGNAGALPHLVEACGGHRRANYTSLSFAQVGIVLGGVALAGSTEKRKGESKKQRLERMRTYVDAAFADVGKSDLASLWALALEVGGPCAVPSDDYSTLRIALMGAAQKSVKKAIPLIERGLDSEDTGEIAQALLATTTLTMIDLRHMLPRVIELLGHEDANLRWRAAEVMGAYPDACEELRQALTGALTDESAHVRVRAAASLHELCEVLEENERVVVECTRAEHSSVRASAARLLGQLQASSPDTVRALGAMLKDDSGYAVYTALGSLNKLKADMLPFRSQLRRLIKHDDRRVVLAAKKALESL